VDVAGSSEIHFGGAKPFCVEAWIKPTDHEGTHTPHTFKKYGGTIMAKYNEVGGLQAGTHIASAWSHGYYYSHSSGPCHSHGQHQPPLFAI